MGIKFPRKMVCPIHGYKSPRPNIGGCNCSECKTFNSALDLCIAAEKESRVGVEEILEILRASELYRMSNYVGKTKKYTEGLTGEMQLATAIHHAIYGEGEA